MNRRTPVSNKRMDRTGSARITRIRSAVIAISVVRAIETRATRVSLVANNTLGTAETGAVVIVGKNLTYVASTTTRAALLFIWSGRPQLPPVRLPDCTTLIMPVPEQ